MPTSHLLWHLCRQSVAGSSLQVSFLHFDSLEKAKVDAQLYLVLYLKQGRERRRSSVLFLWDSMWGQKLKQNFCILLVIHISGWLAQGQNLSPVQCVVQQGIELYPITVEGDFQLCLAFL